MKKTIWLSMEPVLDGNDRVVDVKEVSATVRRPKKRSLVVRLNLEIPDDAFAPFVARLKLDPGDLDIDVEVLAPPDPDSPEFDAWATGE